jgi:Entner-Doudoroff aldolase
MNEVIRTFEKVGVVPAVVIDHAEDALPLADALLAGGLPVAEITFRTEAAADAISKIHKNYPKVLVGAGTVLSCKQVDQARAAGAAFIVSPGLNPKVVQHCLEVNIPVIPGINTPSEVEEAMSVGLRYVKFFPAEASGGLKYIKAISAPYTDMHFLPTGGVNAENAAEYLSCPSVFAIGGSWMVKRDLIRNHDFEEITRMTSEACEIVNKARNGEKV